MNREVKEAVREYSDLYFELLKNGHLPYVTPESENRIVGQFLRADGGVRGGANQVWCGIKGAAMLHFGGFNRIGEYWLSYVQGRELGGVLIDAEGNEYVPDKNDGTNQFRPIIKRKEEYELTAQQISDAKNPKINSITYNKKDDIYEMFVGWKIYKVFNAVEFRGLPYKYQARPCMKPLNADEKVQKIKKIAEDNGIKTVYGQLPENVDGSYNRNTDEIKLGVFRDYKNADNLALTYAHEVFHGLCSYFRENLVKVGTREQMSFDYDYEEIVVEMAAGMLMSSMGVTSTLNNNLSYIQQYINKYSDDFDNIFLSASAQAVRLVNTVNNNDAELAMLMKPNNAGLLGSAAAYLARKTTTDPYEAKKKWLKFMGVGPTKISYVGSQKALLRHVCKHGDETPKSMIEQLGGKNDEENIVDLAVLNLKESMKISRDSGLVEMIQASFNKDVEVEVIPAEPYTFMEVN